MILIGSAAIRHWFPDFNREPKDLDYAVAAIPEKKAKHDLRIEYLINPLLISYFQNKRYTGVLILPPNELYTLKISHLFWNINWAKHMFDVQFLKNKGCVLNKELFFELYNYWPSIHGKNKRSNLKMTAEDFFDNAVKCEYSHDYLHTLLLPTPTYQKILKDNEEVEVDEHKFNGLSHEEKCSLVREEVMVMAWERYKHMDYRRAYEIMLKKFIINHAPIWEALFIIENFIELHKPSFNYFKTIEHGLNFNQ